MVRLALLLMGAMLLTACASTQAPVVAEKPQYCHTSETVVFKSDKEVDSQTVVECTDDEIKKLFQVRSGMAPNCGEFTYWMKIGGHDVQRRGVSCQKPDGTWEIVNTAFNY